MARKGAPSPLKGRKLGPRKSRSAYCHPYAIFQDIDKFLPHVAEAIMDLKQMEERFPDLPKRSANMESSYRELRDMVDNLKRQGKI